MKPISVKFKCFGPYMDEQIVDFEELNSRGLFLICGETGSGKTTILDAICYALFGKSSGGLRGDFEVMRCKSANQTDDTFVEYIFECNGNTYKFHRELKYARKNLNETIGCEVFRKDEFVPLFENPTKKVVNAKAEEIIGLTCEQFCQVVILPQGKFEELLISKSDDKEKILTSLFHADRWGSIVKTIKDRVAEENKRLKAEDESIKGSLNVFGCNSVDELKEKIDALAEEVTAITQEVETIKKAKEDAEKKYTSAIKENELFVALAESQKKLSDLANKKDEFEEKRNKLILGEKADSIRESYNDVVKTNKELTKLQNDAKDADTALKTADKEYKKAIEDCENHEKGKIKYESEKEQKVLLENAVSVYEGIDKKEQVAKEAKKKVEDLTKAAGELQKKYDLARKACEKAEKNHEDAIHEHVRISDQYLSNIAGILARELCEGNPCPVCGSTAHPKLTTLDPSVKVTEKDVEIANDKRKEREGLFKEARIAKEKVEESNTDAQEKLKIAKEELVKAQAEFNSAKEQLVPDIPNLVSLQAKIKQIEYYITSYEEKSKTLNSKKETAKELFDKANQKLEGLNDSIKDKESENKKLKEIFNSNLLDKGFANETEFKGVLIDRPMLDTLRDHVSDYDASVKRANDDLLENQKKVEGKTDPNITELEKNKIQAEADWQDKNDDLTRKAEAYKNAKNNYDTLSKRWKKYNADNIIATSNTGFIDRLDPRSGTSLQKYVLGIMLSSITVAANQLLKSVHNGRYQLYRSNEGSGSSRKVGLELDVLDNSNGEKRSVTTLSGGEKFLVALSLAIGLSTVVQAQSGGTKLEAMFIDEGFGSLDNESINDALDVLQGIQRSHGVVGIISHVDKLMETIPTRLEVQKSKNGNTIKYII